MRSYKDRDRLTLSKLSRLVQEFELELPTVFFIIDNRSHMHEVLDEEDEWHQKSQEQVTKEWNINLQKIFYHNLQKKWRVSERV